MLAPQRVMEIALQNNWKIPSKIRKRYSEILVARAIRFYVENELDSGVVDEDLYNYQDFDCICTQEEANRNVHNPKCEAKSHPYPNLDYSAELESKYQKELKI